MNKRTAKPCPGCGKVGQAPYAGMKPKPHRPVDGVCDGCRMKIDGYDDLVAREEDRRRAAAGEPAKVPAVDYAWKRIRTPNVQGLNNLDWAKTNDIRDLLAQLARSVSTPAPEPLKHRQYDPNIPGFIWDPGGFIEIRVFPTGAVGLLRDLQEAIEAALSEQAELAFAKGKDVLRQLHEGLLSPDAFAQAGKRREP